MSKLRVFVALKISAELQQIIVNWEKDFKSKQNKIHRRCRWIAPANLHITLIPPWYLEIDKVKKLKEFLNSIGGVPPIKLQFTRITYGPDKKHPRLIWASGETPEQLIGLKEQLEEKLGRERGKRRLKLHLTLARFKPTDFSSFSLQEISDAVSWSETIDRFALMQSHLSSAGAQYSTLEEIKLCR